MKKSTLLIFCLVSFVFSANLTRENSIVTDSKTNLQWQDDSNVGYIKKDYGDAIEYCGNLHLGGGEWRVPSINEFRTIVDKSRKPAIVGGFVNTNSRYVYCTTDQHRGSGFYTRAFDFGSGSTLLQSRTDKCYVRCVRNVK